MEDIKIARSQTMRSKNSIGDSTRTSFTFKPWTNRVRVFISGVSGIGTGTVESYMVPPFVIIYAGPVAAVPDQIIIQQSLYDPIDFGIERFGSLVQGEFTVEVSTDNSPAAATILEMELTLPQGAGQAFAQSP